VPAPRLLFVMTSGVFHRSSFQKLTLGANCASSAAEPPCQRGAARPSPHSRERRGKPTIRRLPCILTLGTELLVEAI
jgi:hypothetical protein